MSTKNIKLSIENNIATIYFNRPDQHNVINYDGWLKLKNTVEQIQLDKNIKVLILRGEGNKSFSAGADIKEFSLSRNNSNQAKLYSQAFDGSMDAIEKLQIPTISMIQGFCIGGGCELSTATDIRIATENSKFGVPVAKLGISIGYREMRRLVNLIGPGNTSYILLSGKILDAKEALNMGLITMIVNSSEIEKFTYNLAKNISKLAPLSHIQHKDILQKVLKDPSLEKLTDNEKNFPFEIFDSHDFNLGRKAFISKKTPKFKGD
ncbi:MAG: enoyl-CoA hydratase-related protein [Dehalococcoidia bacterium]